MEIVSRQRWSNQDALKLKMTTLGFKVTQATVSRDLHELNLVKSKQGYRRPEDVDHPGRPTLIDPLGTLRSAVSKIETTSNLLVLRTASGYASSVAIVLDKGDFKEALGTISGDDTVLVATRCSEDATSLKEKLLSLIM